MTSYRICAVCSGNICRSPLAEVVLREAFDQARLADQVDICSAGTGAWHVGDGADSRAITVAYHHGLDLRQHRSQQVDAAHMERMDLVLALDSGHLHELRQLTQHPQIRLLRSFDAEAVAEDDLDVEDPFYGTRADFTSVYHQLRAAAPGIVAHVRSQLAG
ncbi:MAG: low molecular weight protein-tyrosine-phosphatase [Beutenbergiaceae bacterium]